ncbi:uncharacterized protein [Rutidosis leptorrhynchoides]|uniref:uncharacterized protein n=1 Tax=Rutidosis leptorrhynchoides TaxID=125765 RepID=UPI003A99369C
MEQTLLEEDPNAKVIDRVGWNGTNCTGAWSWSREPIGRTANEAPGLRDLITSVIINTEKKDFWGWKLNNNNGFATGILADNIDNRLLNAGTNVCETIGNNLVPKKVEIFVWRLRKKRLPVLIELDKRGIDLNSVRCSICDGDIEMVDHSLIFCNKSMDVWSKIFDWWGLNGIANASIMDLFGEGFGSNSSGISAKILQAVIWTSGYLI